MAKTRYTDSICPTCQFDIVNCGLMLSEHVSVKIVVFMSECLKIYSRAVHINAFTHMLNLKYLTC